MKYSFDNKSLLLNGQRIFPIMGEMHYSRVPHHFWSETLSKMKAGGVTVVSAYVIWIHHEEIEGEYDWSGDRNLKAFCECVKKSGLKFLLRIGPWIHGEVRNGGIPDWLLKKDFEVRSNDQGYFDQVEKWYGAIYEQVKDYIADPRSEKDFDRPIIGVQIENEFGHCGGLYEKEAGELHMRTLQDLAKKVGFSVSLYTATGWGGAWTGGMLPVMGGYCDAPWDPRTEEIEPSGNFVFTHERNDHNIGSDHGFGYGITFDMEKFPYLTAELGGGLQVTAHRRTIATGEDISSVTLVKMGSGVNLLGFYMYAGGTNPEGKKTTLEESKSSGSLNDLPVKSYDFRAPIREFGQISSSLRELKLLALFARSYGEELCLLPSVIDQEVKADDAMTLRYAFRCDKNKGYVFVNNYVRHQKMANYINMSLLTPDKKTSFPPLDIDNKDYFFLPFNMKYGKAVVKTATVTPYLKFHSKGAKELFVFYRRRKDFERNSVFQFKDEESKKAAGETFLVLDRQDALNLYVVGEKYLVICSKESCAWEDERGQLVVSGRNKAEIFVYPPLKHEIPGWKNEGRVNKNTDDSLDPVYFTRYVCENAPKNNATSVYSPNPRRETDTILAFPLDFSDLSRLLNQSSEKSPLNDIFVRLSYTGERANLYVVKDGKRKLLLDNFYLGEKYAWEIGLKRFLQKDSDCYLREEELSNLELEIIPLKKDAKIYLEKHVEFSGNEICRLKSIKVEYEWNYRVTL